MQAILAFVANAGAAVGIGSGTAAAGASAASAAAATAASAAGFVSTPATLAAGVSTATAAGAAATAGTASQILGALRVGTSTVTALSLAAQANASADALMREGRDAEMQARQEFIQAQESANSIERDYNRVVQQQLVVAAASGIDVGSLSVGEARQQARADADRQLTIQRNGADLNAGLRRSRASYLKGAAKVTRETGYLGAAGRLGETALDIRRIG